MPFTLNTNYSLVIVNDFFTGLTPDLTTIPTVSKGVAVLYINNDNSFGIAFNTYDRNGATFYRDPPVSLFGNVALGTPSEYYSTVSCLKFTNVANGTTFAFNIPISANQSTTFTPANVFSNKTFGVAFKANEPICSSAFNPILFRNSINNSISNIWDVEITFYTPCEIPLIFSTGGSQVYDYLYEMKDTLIPQPYGVNTPANGSVLTYNGATQKWIPATGGTVIDNLYEMLDCNIPQPYGANTPANGSILTYNGASQKWLPVLITPTVTDLECTSISSEFNRDFKTNTGVPVPQNVFNFVGLPTSIAPLPVMTSISNKITPVWRVNINYTLSDNLLRFTRLNLTSVPRKWLITYSLSPFADGAGRPLSWAIQFVGGNTRILDGSITDGTTDNSYTVPMNSISKTFIFDDDGALANIDLKIVALNTLSQNNIYFRNLTITFQQLTGYLS